MFLLCKYYHWMPILFFPLGPLFAISMLTHPYISKEIHFPRGLSRRKRWSCCKREKKWRQLCPTWKAEKAFPEKKGLGLWGGGCCAHGNLDCGSGKTNKSDYVSLFEKKNKTKEKKGIRWKRTRTTWSVSPRWETIFIHSSITGIQEMGLKWCHPARTLTQRSFIS